MLDSSNTTAIFAQWVAAEEVDPDLSIIDVGVVSELMGTSQIRFVPRLAHVTGMDVDETVVCLTDPWVIIGVLRGDVTLADADPDPYI